MPGVTDSEIAFGTVSSLSGPVPGVGTSALEDGQLSIPDERELVTADVAKCVMGGTHTGHKG